SLGGPLPNETRGAGLLRRVLPLPFLAGIGLAYFLWLFSPAVSCGDALTQARRYYAGWHAMVLPVWRDIMENDECYVAGVFAFAAVGPLHPLPVLSMRPDDLPKLRLLVPMLTQKPGESATLKRQASFVASRHLRTYILDPLERAVRADPENAL